MTSILLIIILVVFIIIYSLFASLINIGQAGGSPSKLIAGILKKNSVQEEALGKARKEQSAPGLNEAIRKWRRAAGIIFGVVMFYLFLFCKAMFSIEAYA